MATNPFWGPLNVLGFTLDPTIANAGEEEWLAERERNQNPMPIDPLNQNQFGMQINQLPNEAIDTTTPQSYDLMEVMKKSKNPAINYEGLYQDAPSNIATSNIFKAMQPQFEYRTPDWIEHAESKGMYDLAGNVPIDRNRRIDFGRYWSNRPLQATDGVARFEDFNPRVGNITPSEPYESPTYLMKQQQLGMFPIGYQEPEVEADQDITLVEELIDENRIPGRIQKSVPNYQSGWDKFKGKIGDVWSGAKDKLSNFEMPPIGIMGLVQAMNRNPFNINSPNYSKGLGLQVDDLRQVGFLPQKSVDGYKILEGPLAGKNLVSLFGTNDYDAMLAKKAAWFQRRKDLGKSFSQKNWDKVKKEQEARAAEMRAHGQRGVGERTLGGNFQIERGGSDAVNRDLARIEAANRNRSPAARQDTTSMRSAARSYTDAHGNRGYSRGRRDGGRIGYANGGLASLFTRRG